VDRIVADAGIAPTTLYRLFGSKGELVTAYVIRNAEGYQTWFDAAADAAGTDPRRRILSVFEALADQVQPGRCRGCPFLMALAEYPEPNAPGHERAVELKAWVRVRFGELASALAEVADVDDPATLADWLTLAMEGVYASVQALGADGPALHSLTLVDHLLPPIRQGRA
jgi:AcrR family transcriptional regulator